MRCADAAHSLEHEELRDLFVAAVAKRLSVLKSIRPLEIES
jgi:hypothetical protein